jgi:succinylglutamic semialdehyde dehydrogenase
MTLRRATRDGLGNYLDGRFVAASATGASGELAPPSPADLDDTPFRTSWSVGDVDVAIAAAQAAQHSWRKTPREVRAEYLQRYANAVKARREEIAVAIARSIGKPLWEARTEADALAAKVAITLGAGNDLLQFPVMPEPNTRLRLRPVGVCAVLGPFNFPAHLANGHFVPALANGNCVIFKPSEKAPEVGQLLAECMHEAGFPPGVFQLLHGGPEVARALVDHSGVDAVMFTGSTAVGSSILAASARFPGRLIALELGGRNPAIVLEDADIAHTVRELVFSAYVTAGQRCTANSRVLVTAANADEIVARLARAARALRIGHHEDCFLGPVIEERALQRMEAMTAASEHAFEAVVPFSRIDVTGVRGHYAQPSVYLARGTALEGAPLHLEELFAPVLTVEVARDEDDLLARANLGKYGLAAAVFTQDRTRFERLADDLDVGLCNWNRASVGSSSKLPFGGRRASGNHRPAGLFSSFYCVDAVGELHVPTPPSNPQLSPGMNGESW